MGSGEHRVSDRGLEMAVLDKTQITYTIRVSGVLTQWVDLDSAW